MVKSLDLSRYRVVAFATHSLMPGDLDGQTQPALALTAPEVAGIDSDGLLTVEEILALKLNADWVVLSACNTTPARVQELRRFPAWVGPSSTPELARF
jgi:CHAT domain-containing protein